MNKFYYCGIGSRKTPQHVCDLMTKVASYLEKQGGILRSGGADGADKAFEDGVKNPDNKCILLPWRRFNNNPSPYYNIPEEAYTIASEHHCRWYNLKPGVKKLMARNVQQILGPNLDSPVKFVMCWTPDGSASGGTGQAIRVAQANFVPVYDLGNASINSIMKAIGYE